MTQLSILDIATAPALPVGVPFQPRSRTSRAAAERLAPKVANRREQVLALFRSGEQLTADEVAHRLDWRITSARPRVCEAAKWGVLVDTQTERPSDDGLPAAVYRYATALELANALRAAQNVAQYDDRPNRRAEAAIWARVIRAEMEAA